MRAGQQSSTLALVVFCTDELIKMMAWGQSCTTESKQGRQSRQQARLHILAHPGDREVLSGTRGIEVGGRDVKFGRHMTAKRL